jgi:mono/diheme cytochrome c family protein
MKKRTAFTITFFLTAVFLFGILTAFQDKKPWIVPDKNAKIANPNASNANSIKEGKDLWITHCQSCHGKTGKGDGTKAAQLKTEPGNFTLAATQKQSDGSLFFKISEGRGDMPSFKKKIPDAEDIWNLVNYMRTLKG